eukprot:c17947_g1_i1 orf=87-1343(-)
MEDSSSSSTTSRSASGRSDRKGSLGMNQVCVAVCVAVSLFVALDPFSLSIIGTDPSFTAKRVKQPLPSQLAFPRDTRSRLQGATKWNVEGSMGPESLALDARGNGPYTGVADGRILRWVDGKWQEFAHTSPNRTNQICEPGQPMPNVIRNEHICGRPLGLRFNKRTGDLYIADAYLGLLSVGPNGGQAESLAREVDDGSQLSFTNDLDITSDGSVYFTDSSSKYQRRNFFLLVLSGDDSGRLLKYDPRTKKTRVVLRGLQFPNGVALNKDESFLVIAESVPGRLLRHWLKGPQAGETEVMAVLPGYPDNVRMNEQGDFWVAMHCRRNLASMISGALPWLRRAMLQLPIPFKHIYHLFNGGPPHGILAKYSPNGEVLDVLEDVDGSIVKYVSEVDESHGQLLIGSVLLPYIAVYDLHAS